MFPKNSGFALELGIFLHGSMDLGSYVALVHGAAVAFAAAAFFVCGFLPELNQFCLQVLWQVMVVFSYKALLRA